VSDPEKLGGNLQPPFPAFSREPEETEPRRSAAGAGVADARQRSLDPASVTHERIGRGILTAVLAGSSFILLLVVLLSAAPGILGAAFALAGWAVLVLVVAAWSFFWPPVRYRHISYLLDERGIRIRRGVVWRSAVTVPRSRVQHTDVSQGPIERALGLATLIVHTAGTQHASVSLGGLRREEALRIRDQLIEGDEPDAV
jgi:membrane protein YdbS with pleckstrin-like domain